MKRVIKAVMLTLCMSIAVAFALNANFDVAAKSKVTCKLKSGTLTIKGKGNMPKTLKVNKKKVKKSKVKKVVIKKGVKTISNNAFSGFTKLTKVTIPSTVTKIGVNAFKKTKIKTLKIPKKCTKLGTGFINSCKKLDKITVPGSFKMINKNGTVQKYKKSTSGTDLVTVTFNTNLDYKVTSYFRTLNFVTAGSDPEFKSYDGVIYTKDGTGLVRVPSARDTITVRNGCTDFNTYAVTYISGGKTDFVCYDLVKVIVPQSLVRVSDEKYPDEQSTSRSRSLDINIEDTKLEIPEIVKLKNVFLITAENLLKKLPTRITVDGDMYIGDSKYLIEGSSQEKVTIPDGITTICDSSFSGRSVNEITLPASVTKIEKNAFINSYLKSINLDTITSIGKGAFRGTSLTKVELPASITKVPTNLFYDCQSLEEVIFKGDLNSVGASAFYNTKIDLNDFLKNNTKLETIGKSAFQNVGWNNITIPANIKTVGTKAFLENNNTKYVLIKGSTSGFATESFGTKASVTFQFELGVKESWTAPEHDYFKSGSKKKLSVWWDKVSEVSGYQIWIAKDKALKKGIKKYTAKYSQKSKTITLTTKKAKGLKYFGIRPYKTQNSKKVYGKWSIKAL